jgi:MarR family transcriptional regulator, lower aerobic nicotinate degradation pathway regulator
MYHSFMKHSGIMKMSAAEARARGWPRHLNTERTTVTWRQKQGIESRKPSKYVLEDQIGFLVRAVSQRNTELFTKHMIAGLTRVQFATMVKLLDVEFCSQNELGRLVLLDRATIKGVISRLRKRGYIQTSADASDRRQHILTLTKLGKKITRRAIAISPMITDKMLGGLSSQERKQIVLLLQKIIS